MALLDATNLDPDLTVDYELKEAFRVDMAIGCYDTTTLPPAWTRSTRCVVPRASRRSRRMAKTCRDWRTEIVNSGASGGASNGFAESPEPPHQNQKRRAHGYRTWGRIPWPDAVDLR